MGAAKPPNTASLLGWLVELDRQGQVKSSRTFDEVPAGQLYHVAPSDGRLLLAGSGPSADRNEFDGWLVRLRSPSPPAVAAAPPPPPSPPGSRSPAKPQPPGAFSGDLGALDDKHPQIATAGRIGAGETSRYTFALPIAGWVEVALVPQNGDADLVLLGSDSRAPLISANSDTAAEFISASLGAGTYTLDVVGNTESSFRLVLRRGPSNKPSEAVVAVEMDWDIDQRRRVEHGLELLGYGPGEVDGVFTAATRKAIRAFQASLGAPATGWLGDSERLKLAYAAGMAGGKRADAAAARAQVVAAMPMTVVVPLPNGGSLKGEFGGNLVHAIKQPESGSKEQYKGQWRNQDDSYNPDGVGVSAQDDREWAGEYSDGYMTGYGVFRWRGQLIYAGEWQKITSNDRS